MAAACPRLLCASRASFLAAARTGLLRVSRAGCLAASCPRLLRVSRAGRLTAFCAGLPAVCSCLILRLGACMSPVRGVLFCPGRRRRLVSYFLFLRSRDKRRVF